MPKTQYTIRVEDVYLEKTKIIAENQLRSLNNQIEYFIAQAISEYEKEFGTISVSAE